MVGGFLEVCSICMFPASLNTSIFLKSNAEKTFSFLKPGDNHESLLPVL